MKKPTSIFLALTLLVSLLLTGCAQGQAAQDASNSAAAASGEETQAAPRTAGKLFSIPFTTGGYWGANTGDAYYEYARLGEDMEALILKTDYATGEQTCLCQKQGCAHADESCNAFIKSWGRVTLFAYGDTVYLAYSCLQQYEITPEEQKQIDEQIAQEREALGTQEEKEAFDRQQAEWKEQADRENRQCSYIDAISTDGTQKRRIVEFADQMDIFYTHSDGAAVFGFYQDRQSANGVGYAPMNVNLIGVWADLETGEYGTYPFVTDRVLGGFEDKIVIQTTASDQDLEALWKSENFDAYQAALQNATWEYYGMDPFTGDLELITTLPTKNEPPFLLSNTLYYKEYEEGQETADVYGLPLTSSEPPQLIAQIPSRYALGRFNPEIMPPQSEQPQRYIRAVDERSMQVMSPEPMFDFETGEIKGTSLNLGTFEYGNSTPVVAAQTNDGRWLIMIGGMTNRHNDRCRYALITPEDFFASNPNHTEVKMYETA